jgi:hypothetical protein
MNQQNKKNGKKAKGQKPHNSSQSKFMTNGGSKPAGGMVNKKGLTGGSRGS